jgi:hypothetical protein
MTMRIGLLGAVNGEEKRSESRVQGIGNRE